MVFGIAFSCGFIGSLLDVCFRDFVIRKMREGLIGPKISYTAINSIVNL
jgi:hypothetical protein